MTNTTDLMWHPTDGQPTDQPSPPPAGFEYDTPMVADQWEDQFEPVGTMPVVGDRVDTFHNVDGPATVIRVNIDFDIATLRLERSNATRGYTYSKWATGADGYRVYKRKPDTSTLPATETTEPAKRDILTEAKARLGIKDDQHGPAEHSFPLIAALWSEYLGTKVSPVDVSAMMILLKCARAKHGHGTFDTWLDIIGYSVCGQQMVGE